MLVRSGLFDRVVVDTERDSENDRVDLRYELEARPPNTWRSTIGFGTDTGARIQLGWTRHYLSSKGNRLELALGAHAIWALGRIGDPAAVPALRESLDSPFRSIQAHAARALGALKDAESGPIFLSRLADEADKGLQMAYASALGHLQVRAAIPVVLEVLDGTPEEHFIQLVQQARSPTGAGTALAQDLIALKKKLGARAEGAEMAEAFRKAGDAFAHDDLARGSEVLGGIIGGLIDESVDEDMALILKDCVAHLRAGAGRIEYVFLGLHVLDS